jgi:hypothetical protein
MDFSNHFYGGFYEKEITLIENYQDTVQIGNNISLSRESRRLSRLVTKILQRIQFISQWSF